MRAGQRRSRMQTTCFPSARHRSIKELLGPRAPAICDNFPRLAFVPARRASMRRSAIFDHLARRQTPAQTDEMRSSALINATWIEAPLHIRQLAAKKPNLHSQCTHCARVHTHGSVHPPSALRNLLLLLESPHGSRNSHAPATLGEADRLIPQVLALLRRVAQICFRCSIGHNTQPIFFLKPDFFEVCRHSLHRFRRRARRTSP